MLDDVKRFVRNCHTCTRIKPNRQKPSGLLRPLPVAEQRGKHYSMDFIVELPPGNRTGAQNILVTVDRCTKRVAFEATNKMDAAAVTDIFVRRIFSQRGLLDSLISDRGTQFVSDFWRTLCQRLSIKANFSTAFHPETDGQTERINQELEQYLRAFTSFRQDDWEELLPLAEFAINNHESSTTQMTPFFADTGTHPRMGFESTDSKSIKPIESKAAIAYARRMEEITDFCKAQIITTRSTQAEYANQHRQASPAYAKGDEVWLDTSNIKTLRPSKKLDHKWAGPYRIHRMINPQAYELALPASLKVHPVFHTSMLRLAANDPLEGQRQPPPPPVLGTEDDPEAEWAVTAIVGCRPNRRRRRHEYHVHWKGYPPDQFTWEPEEHLINVQDLVKEFHERYPDAHHPSKGFPPLRKKG